MAWRFGEKSKISINDKRKVVIEVKPDSDTYRVDLIILKELLSLQARDFRVNISGADQTEHSETE